MNVAKKILTILAISALAIIVGLVIAAIFGFDLFTGLWLKILLTLATLALVSTFSISALNFFPKKRILSIIALSLFAFLLCCVLIILWSDTPLTNDFAKITGISALAVFLFNFIIFTKLRLEGRYVILQIITYIFASVVVVVLSLSIVEVDVFGGDMWKIWLAVALAMLALSGALSILARKNMESGKSQTKTKDGEKLITITEGEYNKLRAEIKDLQNQLKNTKTQ